MKFSTLTTFNDLGQVSEVSEPYPSGLEATLKTLYAYRNDGRILSQTLPNNVVINYSYLGNKTTTSYSTGEVFYKINDATGLLVESKDPGGIIKYFYESDGQPKKIEAPGGNTEFTYNSKRLQATLIDPDAGTTSYQYDGFNQLSTQISANLVSTTLTYDKLGRIIKEEASVGDIKNYLYDCMGARGKLYEINNGKTGVEESSEKYKYDALTRLTEETRRYGGEAFTFKYNYNTKGNISKVTYPAGMELNYTYNSLQELTTIKNGASLVWQRGTINSDGQIENATFGNNKQISYTYDSEKRLTGMNVNDLIAFNYEYNNKQQLVYRDEKYKSNGSWIGFKEDFTYDGANRLETVSKAGVQTLSMSYQSNMISNKSDAGTYDYASSANHRLTNVTPNYGSTEHDISYTRTGKVDKITETGSIIKELAINYGVDDQRFKTEYKENNVRKYTRYFFKDYEKEVSATGAIRHLNYIYAGGSLVGIYEQKSPANAMHYIYTDHLGSIRCITNSAGVVEQGLSYDAWGNRRNPGTGEKYTSTPTGLMFYRGYTGHEHLDELGLINMNGRVYDPAIALFLSPDNYVQSPTNSQNFNRYAYCLNNPLMFTDPTGELTWFDIGAGLLFVGGIVSEILAPGNPWGTAAIVSGFSHFAYTINGVEDEGKSWNDASTYAGINASISFDFNWPEFNQHHIVEYDPGAEYVDPITGQSYSANSGSETYDNFLANAGFYTNPGDMNYKRSYDVYFGSNYNTGFTPYIDENMYCVFENAEYLSSIHQGGFSREDYILQTMIDHPEIDIINVGLADYPTIMRSNFKWGKNIDYFTDVYRRINSGQPLSAVIPGNPYHAVTIVGYNTTTYELIYMDPQRGFYRFSINEILSLSGLIPIKRPRW